MGWICGGGVGGVWVGERDGGCMGLGVYGCGLGGFF